MKKTYTTGQLAKQAGVSERTIRYYDQKGLLKPSFIMENGYRCYDEHDVMQLEKILTFKYLNFSLQEIESIIKDDNQETLQASLEMQIHLLENKIQHMLSLKESLLSAKDMLELSLNWHDLANIVKEQTNDEKIMEHYRDAKHLSIRIHLHEVFSVNKQGWFPWLFEHIQFQSVNRLLELGCGNGVLWKNSTMNIRNREIFLSDHSQGMVDTARNLLGEDYSYMVIDCQKIPFKRDYFDAVIANHVLFYMNDIDKGLKEIQRVIRDNGTFYCSTYGRQHMHEINQLVKEFNRNIVLSDHDLSNRFGIEDGEIRLKKFFTMVSFIPYEDALEVNQVEPLLEYIMSCHGNQKKLLDHCLPAFHAFLEGKIKEKGSIHITKQAGLFICKK